MQEIRRNLIYEVKKESSKRSQPFFNPNSEDDDIRAENQRLRAKVRSLDTEVIRLNAKIDQLTQQIAFCSLKYTRESSEKEDGIKQAVSEYSKMPMILENKQLKESNEILNREILLVNQHKNKLQAELRQIRSDKYGLEMRIKEYNILQKMREERFKDEVDKLTPIFIDEPQDYSILKNAVSHLTNFIRSATVEVVDNLFALGIKECEGNKKLNSFTVFNNYWEELKSKRAYGYAAVAGCYRSLKKVIRIFDQHYAEVDLEDSHVEESIDSWVVNSIVEMKTQCHEVRRLFRLLALKYRCKFPIKGEKWEINQKVKAYLQHSICEEVIRMLVPNLPRTKDQQKMVGSSENYGGK